VPPDDIPAMVEVARAVRIPAATGKRLSTRAEFAAVLRAGAASIRSPHRAAQAVCGRRARLPP